MTARAAAAAAREALLLPEHHLAIEDACRALLSDTLADEPRALGERWRLFERQVEDHFRAEEELILPDFALAAPAAAERIHKDHAVLRGLMERLGVEVDLHVIRARSVQAMIAELRSHAEREEELFYPWAQQHLSADALSSVRARVARWLP